MAEEEEDKRGADITTLLEITLKEAVYGTSRSIKLSRRVVCDNCEGSGGEKKDMIWISVRSVKEKVP